MRTRTGLYIVGMVVGLVIAFGQGVFSAPEVVSLLIYGVGLFIFLISFSRFAADRGWQPWAGNRRK